MVDEGVEVEEGTSKVGANAENTSKLGYAHSIIKVTHLAAGRMEDCNKDATKVVTALTLTPMVKPKQPALALSSSSDEDD